jgi:hypothetical protein
MAGLVPAIHVSSLSSQEGVDPRNKSRDDDEKDLKKCVPYSFLAIAISA